MSVAAISVALGLAIVVSLWVDRSKHHSCRPPDAYWEESVGGWMTRRPVGARHDCRCGTSWATVSYAGGPWRRWVRR